MNRAFNAQNAQNESLEFEGFQQLLFIVNAISNGWVVREVSSGVYECEKDIAAVPTKYKNTEGTDVKDSFIYKFLKNNLSQQCKLSTKTSNARA